MRRPITTIVAVATLGVLLASQAHAQIKRDKQPPGGLGGLTTPITGPNAGKSDPLPKIDVLGLLTIESLSMPSVTGSLKAVIKSAAAQPLEATYTFSRWNGKTWTTLGKTATVTVPAKKTAEVMVPFRRSADAERLKLVLTNTAHKVNQVKELRLAALKKTSYLVRYMTKNGGPALIYDYEKDDRFMDTSLKIGRDKVALARSYGFEAEMPVTTSNIGRSYRIRVYAQLEKAKERTFDTLQEAKNFRAKIWSIDEVSQPLFRGAQFDVTITEQ